MSAPQCYQNSNQKIKFLLTPYYHAQMFLLSTQIKNPPQDILIPLFANYPVKLFLLHNFSPTNPSYYSSWKIFYQPTHHILPLGRMFPHLTCQLLSLVHNLILIACIFFRYNLVRFFLLNSLPNETILSLLEIFQPTQLLPLAHILELSFKILPNEYTCKTPLTHSSCIIFLLSL